MKVFFSCDEDNRVLSWGSTPTTANFIEVELEEDANELKQPLAYVVKDGELVKDEEFLAQSIEEEKALLEKPSISEEVETLKSVSSALIGGERADEITAAKQLNHALRLFGNTLPEEDALVIAGIFPEWSPDVKYKKDDYVLYGLNQDNEPQMYRVVKTHTSQLDWTPDLTASLFTKVGFTETGTPIWIQPMGGHDAYAKGDIVSHNGILYQSIVNGNVWAPDVYGWVLHGEASISPSSSSSKSSKNK